MTTESVTFDVDTTELANAVNALQDLVRSLTRTEKATDDVADSANKAARAESKLAKETRDLSSATNASTRNLSGLAAGLGPAAAAFGGIGAAMAAAQAVMGTLTEGYNRFIETNAEAKQNAENFSGALNGVLLSFGESIATNESFQRVQEKLIQLFSDASDTGSALGNTLQSLIDGAMTGLEFAVDAVVFATLAWNSATDVVSGAIAIMVAGVQNSITFLDTLRLSAIRLGAAFAEFVSGAFNSAVESFQGMISAIAPFADTLGIDLSSVQSVLEGVSASAEDSMNRAVSAQEEATRDIARNAELMEERSTRAMENLGRALTASAEEYVPSATNIVSANETIARSANTAEEATKRLTEALMENAKVDLFRSTKGQSEEAIAAINATAATERKYLADRLAEQESFNASLLQAERDVMQLMQDLEAQAAQNAADQAQTRKDNALEAYGEIRNGFMALGSTIANSAGKSAKEQRKAIGSVFAAQGLGYILEAPAAFFSKGPQAAGIFAGTGAALLALGKGLGGRAFGGAGGASATAAAPAQSNVVNTTNQTFNISTGGGLLRDPRETSIAVADQVRQASRIGA